MSTAISTGGKDTYKVLKEALMTLRSFYRIEHEHKLA